MKTRSRVSLIQGHSRYENIAQALSHIADEIDLSDNRQVLIKPNFVSTRRQLAATHVDAMRGVLDFLRDRYNGPLTIAEGASLSDTFAGYRNFGYLPLAEEYGAELVDLNGDETVTVQVFDRRLRPLQLRVARRVVEADYRISVGPPKTHDTVIATASIKNIVMGALVNRKVVNEGNQPPTSHSHNERSSLDLLRRLYHTLPSWITDAPPITQAKQIFMSQFSGSDKAAMHQGYPAMNLNIGKVAPLVMPHLAVIDGFEAMEGQGPVSGDPVPWRVALASTDALAADMLTVYLMGLDPEMIGYLQHCHRQNLGVGDLDRIKVVGNTTIEACRRQFRPHRTWQQQAKWFIADVGRLLQQAT
jgi:uncharacterized protein (DUF362 family)